MIELLIENLANLNALSIAFIIIMTTIFILSLFKKIESKKLDSIHKAVASKATETLTSLGILGTFTGIFIGLLGFNPNNLNESIPILLEGLKLAFLTSILGILYSLILKFLNSLRQENEISEDETVGEAVVKTLKQMLSNNTKTQIRILESLSREKEHSIITQITKNGNSIIHQTNIIEEGFKNQSNEISEFSKKISETFAKALIEELKETIKEFNNRLSEQFGKNFQKLNEAVGNLLVWQEKHVVELNEMKESMEKATSDYREITREMGNIVDNMAKINKHTSELDNIEKELVVNLVNLKGAFEGFSKLTSESEKMIGNLDNYFTKFDENMENSLGNTLNEIVMQLSAINKKFVEDYKPLIEQAERIQRSLAGDK